MELTPEIQTAARQLGQALRQDDYLRAYINALEESQTDSEASTLEKKMYDEYKALIAREQAGETLTEEDIDSFSKLRQQVHHLPLIARNHEMLEMVRPLLAEIAKEISFALGVDYVALAKPQ